jgi:hypothetical protein
MSLKTETYRFLLDHSTDDDDFIVQIRKFQREHKGLRIDFREKDSILLNFQGRGPWFTPDQFREDFRSSTIDRLMEERDKLLNLDEGLYCDVIQSMIDDDYDRVTTSLVDGFASYLREVNQNLDYSQSLEGSKKILDKIIQLMRG